MERESADLPLPLDAARVHPFASSRYLNRENTWLDFNERVIALAEHGSLPLLERVKFLAISSRNLDHFFQVRVAESLPRALAPLPLRRRRGRAAQLPGLGRPDDPQPSTRAASRGDSD